MSQEIIDFEPRLAFDGGPFGIRILSRLISEAPRFLRAGGWLAFEVGHGQGPGILKRIEQRGEYVDVFEVSDKQGEIRAILARLRLVGSAIQTFEKVADPTYVVVAANVAEESAEICSLWQTGLDANYSHQAKFDWYYRRHPDGIPEAFFLKYGNSKETVGVAAIGHRRMRQNGKSVLAGVLVDFVVLPEHRTLFPALTLQRDVRRRALISHQLAWGLPNSSATAVFSRAGYQCVGQLVRYVRVLRSAEYLTRYLPSWFSRTIGPVIDWTRFAGILLHSLGKRHYITHWQKQPDKRFDDLWERSSKPDELMGSRDERFLTWRFVNCPIGVYSFFTLVSKSDQRLVGYAVCEFANPSLRVRDFLTETESPGALSFLFRELAKDAFRKGYTTLVTEFLGSETIQTELAETGLIARERSPLYGAVTGESWKLPQEKHWYLTCADMDG